MPRFAKPKRTISTHNPPMPAQGKGKHTTVLISESTVDEKQAHLCLQGRHVTTFAGRHTATFTYKYI